VFERFTKDARTVVVGAQEHARTFGHARVDSTHLLLAVADGGSAGARVLTALGVHADELREAVRERPDPEAFSDEEAAALRSVGIDLEEIRRSVDLAFGSGALDRPPRRGTRLTGHIPFTREAKRSLELSLREAIRLRQRHIGTEHLLLGMVRDDRSGAAVLLARRGVTPHGVRQAAEVVIATGGDASGRTATG